jgi:hypothetical protein
MLKLVIDQKLFRPIITKYLFEKNIRQGQPKSKQVLLSNYWFQLPLKNI